MRAMTALHMLQVDFAEFLGVSDRTMRRWIDGGTRLSPATLTQLVEAVHARDPALASRIAAAHDVTLADLGIGLAPEQVVAYGIVQAAAEVLGVPPHVMRPALVAAVERARGEGVTVEGLHALLVALGAGG